MVEIFSNDRVVGGLTPACAEQAAQLYRTFVTGEILLTDATTAEMAKLTENSFRDVNIAFANELAEICDELSLDVWEVIRLANRHPRVNILNPGPGVGGHCIAVDPWFIVAAAPEQARLIRTARETNDARPQTVVAKVRTALGELGRGGDGEGATVACLGLAFKADIDDLRESPAVQITEQLATELPGAAILAVEPHVTALPKSLDGRANVALAEVSHAVRDADVVLLLVDHQPFKHLTLGDLDGKRVIDTRGIWR
jgi:UDP-N-acetyl-D-mannosaminuronic acid dehydrogenase